MTTRLYTTRSAAEHAVREQLPDATPELIATVTDAAWRGQIDVAAAAAAAGEYEARVKAWEAAAEAAAKAEQAAAAAEAAVVSTRGVDCEGYEDPGYGYDEAQE
jgi:PPE-repeat protein